MIANLKYAVVNKDGVVVRGAGGHGYAFYKTLPHAQEKVLRESGARVVKVLFEEIEQ